MLILSEREKQLLKAHAAVHVYLGFKRNILIPHIYDDDDTILHNRGNLYEMV
jgi:hypothetical protein